MKNWEGVGSVTTAFSLDKHLSEMGFGLAHCWMNVRWDILLCVAKKVWNRIKSWGLYCSSDLIFYDHQSKLSIYCKSRVWYKSCNGENGILMNLLAWKQYQRKLGVTVVLWATQSPLWARTTGLSASVVVVSLSLVPEMAWIRPVWICLLTWDQNQLSIGAIFLKFPCQWKTLLLWTF